MSRTNENVPNLSVRFTLPEDNLSCHDSHSFLAKKKSRKIAASQTFGKYITFKSEPRVGSIDRKNSCIQTEGQKHGPFVERVSVELFEKQFSITSD